MSEPDTSPLPPSATLVVPSRFNGPPHSGNGGWSCGALSWALVEATDGDVGRVAKDGEPVEREAWPAVEVTLRQPPPLDTPLPLLTESGSGEPADVRVSATSAGSVVATARLADDPVPVEPVTPEQVAAATDVLPSGSAHPFSTCFACGPERDPADGLRLTPRRVDATRVAALWRPHPSLAGTDAAEEEHQRTTLPVVWAALDCPGGWAEDLLTRPMALGRMTARVDALPVIGEEHVVVGELRGRDGRKTFTAATLYDADGREVATAEHTWIAVDPASFGW